MKRVPWGHFLSVIIFLQDYGEHSLVCMPVLPRSIVPWLIAVGGFALHLALLCIPAFWFLLILWTCDCAGERDVRSMFQNTWQGDLSLRLSCAMLICAELFSSPFPNLCLLLVLYINLPVCFHLCLWPDPYNVSHVFHMSLSSISPDVATISTTCHHWDEQSSVWPEFGCWLQA